MFLLLLEHLVSIPWYFDQIWGGSKFGKRCLSYRFNGCDEGKQDIAVKDHLFASKFTFLTLSPDSVCKILLDSCFCCRLGEKASFNSIKGKKGWVIQSFVLNRILCLYKKPTETCMKTNFHHFL